MKTDNANTIQIDAKTVTLGGGASTTVPLKWNTTEFAKGSYIISAEANQVQGETYTVDNFLQGTTVRVTVPGDVTGDFIVNIQDATQIGVHWLTKAPPAPANVDINGDSNINIVDASIVGINWQKHV